MGDQPKGVVGVLMDEKGYVWAEASDFNDSGYGGYTLAQAQEYRVRDALAGIFIRRSCADPIAKAMEAYDCKKIVQTLERSHGFKQHIIRVGWEPDQ